VSASTEQHAQPWAAADAAAVTQRARKWLGSQTLAELVAKLGGPPENTADADALLAWSAARLDTRAGRERHNVTTVPWSPSWVEALVGAAADLGLMSTPPPQRAAYDLSVVLGGTTLGNVLRTQLTAELIRTRSDLGCIVVLTADRALSGRETTEAIAGEFTEAANALRVANEVLGPLRPVADHTEVDEGRERCFTRADGGRLRLLVAGSATSARRPTTVDAVRFALARTAVSDREHVLILSSAIYTPFQFFRVAPLLLAEGTRYVELVGTPTDATVDRRHLAQRIAQETHAAIHAAADLLRAAPD
jgi:hypothetical protein